MGGHTVNNGNNIDLSSNYDPLFRIENDDNSKGQISSGELKILNGTISDFSSQGVNSKELEFGMGTVQVINNKALKEIDVNFNNNKSNFGGAIFVASVNDIDGNLLVGRDFENSEIGAISGNFTSNKAAYLGGAIYNSGADIKNGIIQGKKDLNSKITITTKGKDTVFRGNSANVAGGALFNLGTANIEAKDGNRVIFETTSDTIYNGGELNIISGETIVKSSITDEKISADMMGAVQSFGETGITNIAKDGTLSLENNAIITQREINVNGALEAQNGGKITGALKIGSTGTADLNPSNLTSSVINNGDLALWDGTLSQNINGNGITAILGEVTNNAVITQKTFGIEKEQGENGIFTTNLDNLKIADKEIHNYGTLILTGGTNENKITSSYTYPDSDIHDDTQPPQPGITKIKGDVVNNAKIAQAVEIQSGKLTSNADNIDSIKIGNNTTYNVIGGALKTQ